MAAESDDLLSVRDGYAAWAPLYDGDGNPLIPLEGPAVRALLGSVAGRSVLDLGCGTGRHALALAEAGADVSAIDSSPEMLAEARRKSRAIGRPIFWICLDLPAPLPVADAAFDAVVMGLAAEHVSELGAVLAEVARVLRPGGRFILSSLHPDRLLEGQRARFIDPTTGLRQPIATVPRSVDDYLSLAASAGLLLVEHRSLVADAALADQFPRAARYVGRNLGWIGCWTVTT